MSKVDALYIEHMLFLSRKVAERAERLTREAFDADEDAHTALMHWVQTIGEAATRVSAEFRSQHAEIPWHQITGMRHRIVHDYLHVDMDILWVVVSHSVPQLIALLEPLTLPPVE